MDHNVCITAGIGAVPRSTRLCCPAADPDTCTEMADSIIDLSAPKPEPAPEPELDWQTLAFAFLAAAACCCMCSAVAWSHITYKSCEAKPSTDRSTGASRVSAADKLSSVGIGSKFDDEFDDYLRDRFADPLAGLIEIAEGRPGPDDLEGMRRFVLTHPGDLIGRLQLAVQLYRSRDFDEAERHFRTVLEIFPDFGGADSPLWFIARIQQERGDLEAAARTLDRLNGISESHYSALLTHSEILAELGRHEESAAALGRAVLVWPYDVGLHERLAELHSRLGNARRAATERAAVVALDPVDRAQALYLLAVAQRDAGDMRGARRSVMGSLEIAPNYEEALEFLLALRGAGG